MLFRAATIQSCDLRIVDMQKLLKCLYSLFTYEIELPTHV